MIKATLQLGSLSVTVEAKDEKELFQRIGFFTNDVPCACGNCRSRNIVPTHRKIKGFDFYLMRCNDCEYEFSFGQKKEDSSLFPKKEEGWKAPFSRQSGGGDYD